MIEHHDDNMKYWTLTPVNFLTTLFLCTNLNIYLWGKSKVMKPHLYKYWMMVSTAAKSGTAIDFILLLS